MKISEQIFQLKRETNAITLNPILSLIDIEIVQHFEAKALIDENYRRKLKNISNNLKGLTFEYTKKYQDIFNSYNELIVFELINNKTDVSVEFIKEEKGNKTPDFKISSKDSFIFSDLKTLNFADGNNNYIEIQKDSFESNVKLEKQIKNSHRGLFFGDPVSISPFKKGSNFGHFDIKSIIEEIISKVISLYKPKQINYLGSNGILIIDTTQLLVPASLNQGLPITRGFQYGELNSGILWNVAFGEIGDPTYTWIEFEGKPNIGEKLKKNGILKDESFLELKAIAFITNDIEQKKIIGFHRTNETDESLLIVLNKICDFVNDETNSRFWEIDEHASR
ncbi:hypothetical protein [Flavobacterium sp. JAS]|uniref:hypothetical protein n=1 Tax=Flavobacterium sp. JAS TaxID=2897329 RepID=UPI001E6033A7|nr:hypothetical protein [Flavobacterium sp. JAS]MCD0472512.1 hypothetical protein [Flavobacterium sp. JAS]